MSGKKSLEKVYILSCNHVIERVFSSLLAAEEFVKDFRPSEEGSYLYTGGKIEEWEVHHTPNPEKDE